MSSVLLAQYAAGALTTAVFHPIGYAKILIQSGYEPLPPKPAVSFFGKESLVYPNVFQYISHIKSVDGFFGLYRGVFPRVISATIGSFVQHNVTQKVKEKYPTPVKETNNQEGEEEDELLSWTKSFIRDTSQESLARCAGIIASHPFQVVTVRCMIQFIGRETGYDTVFSSIWEIYNNDGIRGFFAGLIPRLVGEMLTLWITNFLAKIVNLCLVPENDMKAYSGAACSLVVAHFTYPYTLTSNIMAMNGSGLKGASPPRMPEYSSWLSCWDDLKGKNQLKRGASMFWRYYQGPVTMRDGQLVPTYALM